MFISFSQINATVTAPSKILVSDISGSEILEAKAENHAGDLTSEVHLIIQLPVLNGTSEVLVSRQEEYLDTLRRNLAHPQVTCTSRVPLQFTATKFKDFKSGAQE